MKKLITYIAIIAVLGMATLLGSLVIHDVKELNKKTVENNKVDETDEIENDTAQLGENNSKESTDDKNSLDSKDSIDRSVTASTKDKKTSAITITDQTEEETSESTVYTDNSNDVQGPVNTEENATSDSNSNDSDGVNSSDSNSSDTSEKSENIDETKNNSGSVKTENPVTSDGEDAEDAVEAALNISNPSIEVSAVSAILLDGSTGKVLYHKNATKKVYPASTTKLVTALVALDYCELDEKVTIGEEIYEIASDSSRANLIVGEQMTMKTLLEGMLIPSGNDAAYSVAAYVGRAALHKKVNIEEAIQEFVRLMNRKVAELGLKSTYFMNPDGYDKEGQFTTAYDMGMIAMAAVKNKTIREITGMSSATNELLSGETVTWNSSNKLIVSGSGEYYKYAIGLKTGSSSLAGKCLVSAAEKDDKTYISVVMNSTSMGRWEDSIALLSYGIQD